MSRQVKHLVSFQTGSNPFTWSINGRRQQADTVIALARASEAPYDLTVAGVPIFRDAETDHILVCGAPGSGKRIAIKELLDQIRDRGDGAIL
jgi:Cdc6-like AAA superfamily ATPase